MKRFFYYFFFTIFIGLLIHFGMKYQVQLQEEAQTNFNLFPVVVFDSLFPILIGLLLRLPKLIIEIRAKKLWTFDWIKFTSIAIPALYITTMSILPYSPLANRYIAIPKIILIGSPTITTIAGIVFGYILLDSIKKEESPNYLDSSSKETGT
ncbi:hypothetical protein [Halobacillus sp. BBL2006]|uniref:hypothetical protein n=1 Tax=Halobacillus sp. BBL2006 TaxID=1543706 RepID=UPI00068AE43A|nr:hypothetical protein [Halobacillus sp. BBL2006]